MYTNLREIGGLLLAGILLVAGGCDMSAPTAGPDDVDALAIVNATVIPGTGSPPVESQTLLISDGKIVALGAASEIEVPDSVLSVDGTGRFVMPGLIDTHVHLATDPSGTDNREAVEGMLAQALDRGITSVRDMAGDTRALADLKRDALLFDIHSPDIYFSALMAGPAFFSDPRTHSSAAGLTAGETPWMRAVTPNTDLLYAVAEAKGTGATGIKIYANLGPAEVDRITAEAHQQGMMVWSHGTIGPAGPVEAVASGVDVLSHISHLRWVAEDSVFTMRGSRARQNADSTFWELPVSNARVQSFLRDVLRAGTLLDPTLSVFDAIGDRPGAAKMRAWAIQITREAHRLGIPVATGTDVDGEVATLREIGIMVDEVGMPPLDVITAATLNGARVIGIASETGSVEVGKYADLLILDGNPAVDIAALEDIHLVLKRGRRVAGPGR